MPLKSSLVRLIYIGPYLAPFVIALAILAQIGSIVLLEPISHDEAELLRAFYMISHGAVPWVQFFENHSSLYLWINGHLLATDAALFPLYARLLHFAVFLLGAILFVWAAAIWLEVEAELFWPFALFSTIVYLPLAWTTTLGIIRPEGYGFVALFAGFIAGHTQDWSAWSCLRLTLCGFLLGAAALISMRTVPLCPFAMALVVSRTHQRGHLAKSAAFLMLGISGVCAFTATIAPISGFYRWLIEFNGHFVPSAPRELPGIAYSLLGSLGTSFPVTVLAVGLLIADAKRNDLARRLASKIGYRLIGGLVVTFAAIITSAAFLLEDHAWAAQGFAGVAIACGFYFAILFLITARIYAHGLARPIARILLNTGKLTIGSRRDTSWSSTRPNRKPERSNAFSRHSVHNRAETSLKEHPLFLTIISLMFIIVAAYALVWIGDHHELPRSLEKIRDQPWQSRFAEIDFLSWPKWFFGPAFAIFLLQTSTLLPPTSRIGRALETFSPGRLIPGLATVIAVVAAFFLLDIARAVLPASLNHWPSITSSMAFAIATTCGLIWSRTNPYLIVYAISVSLAELLLDISSPSQIVLGAILGVIIAYAICKYYRVPAPNTSIFADAGGLSQPPKAIADQNSLGVGENPLSKLGALTQGQSTAWNPASDFQLIGARLLVNTILFAVICILAAKAFNYDIIRGELRSQTRSHNLDYMQTAITERRFLLHSRNDLLPLMDSANLGEWILWSQRYCTILQNEAVAMRPPMHPPCARDVSFYWYGGQDILAIKEAHVPFTPDPPYHLASDVLKARPAIVDPLFLKISTKGHPLDDMIKHFYVHTVTKSRRNSLLIRKDWLQKQLSR